MKLPSGEAVRTSSPRWRVTVLTLLVVGVLVATLVAKQPAGVERGGVGDSVLHDRPAPQLAARSGTAATSQRQMGPESIPVEFVVIDEIDAPARAGAVELVERTTGVVFVPEPPWPVDLSGRTTVDCVAESDVTLRVRFVGPGGISAVRIARVRSGAENKVVVRAFRPPELHLTITDHDGGAVPGCRVEQDPRAPDDWNVGSLRTGSDGTLVCRTGPGMTWLRVYAPSGQSLHLVRHMTPGPNRLAARIPRGEQVWVRVVSGGDPRVSGRVVQLRWISIAPSVPTTAQVDGPVVGAVIPVDPGRTVKVLMEGDTLAEVPVSETSATTVQEVDIGGLLELRVRVRTREGRAAGGAGYRIVRTAPGRFERGFVLGAEGVAVLKHMPPGVYQISTAPATGEHEAVVLVEGIQLGASRDTAECAFVDPTLVPVAGTVGPVQGAPVDGVRLAVSPVGLDDRATEWMLRAAGIAAAPARSDGTFSLGVRLAPGAPIRLRVSAAGRRDAEHLTVAGDETLLLPLGGAMRRLEVSARDGAGRVLLGSITLRPSTPSVDRLPSRSVDPTTGAATFFDVPPGRYRAVYFPTPMGRRGVESRDLLVLSEETAQATATFDLD